MAPEEPTSKVSKVPVQVMSGADGTLLGAASVEVDGAGPQPSDDTGGSLRDLVMHDTGIDVSGSAALDDAPPAPGSSGAVDMGVSRLLLSSSPSFLPPAYRLEVVG
jgi:hypothetical protein